MSGFKTILFATDFSENAGKAFEEAVDIAKFRDAKLFILNVVPAGDELVLPGAQAPAWLPDEDEILAKLEETYVAKAGVGAEAAVRYGAQARRIVDYAEEVGADLIVVGARGMGWVVGFFGGGSIADKVVKNAKVPVLVVPA